MSSFLRDKEPLRSRYSAHRRLRLLFLLPGLHSGLYHSVQVDALTRVLVLIGKGKPKAEEAECVASCRFGVSFNRNAAMDPQQSSTGTMRFFDPNSSSDSSGTELSHFVQPGFAERIC